MRPAGSDLYSAARFKIGNNRVDVVGALIPFRRMDHIFQVTSIYFTALILSATA